jgi:hypothetical protein
MTRYRTVAYCTDPDCRCDHRRGVILYDGGSREDAADAAERLAPRGYAVEVEAVEAEEAARA